MKIIGKISLLTMLTGLILSGWAISAFAQDGDIILSTRLRHEHVNQAGLKDANALTFRARLGYEYALTDQLSVLAEGEGVLHLNSDFSDTVNNNPGQAIVADPEDLELNRLQLAWKGENASATVGRQRIILDKARFVGNVGFRQNEQTFDALWLGYTPSEKITIEYIFIDKVHRIFGNESPMGEFKSDSHIFRASAKTSLGDFTGYGLWLDFENARGASGKTWGASWSKSHKANFGTIGLKAEAAIQNEWHGAGPQSSLGYRSAAISFKHGKITGSAEIDILEGSGESGFITPLATLHAFQGWADVFLVTPATGIRDIHVGLNGNLPKIRKDAKPVSWAIRYHDFSSDSGSIHLGIETDARLNVPIDSKFAIEGKLAHFNGDRNGPANRTKIWLSFNVNF